MRLLLWLTLVVLCAVSGDHVLAVTTGVLLIACADDHPQALRKPVDKRWFGRDTSV